MPNKHILFIVTSHDQFGSTDQKTGFHLSEMTDPFILLSKAGFNIDIASPKGGSAPIDPSSYDLTIENNKAFFDHAEYRKKIEHTMALHQVNAQQYKAVYIPGGHGTMWDFPDHPVIGEIVKTIYEHNGFVGAVCHGPAAFVNLRLSNGDFIIKNKKFTCFSNSEERKIEKDKFMPFLLEDKLIEQGGLFSAARLFEKHVMEDSRIITGQNPASAQEIANRLIKHLG